MIYNNDDSSSEGPEDPLVRIMRMAEEDDRLRDEGDDSDNSDPDQGDGPRGPRSRINDMDDDDSEDEEANIEANKGIIARIIAMRLGATDKGGGKKASSSKPPAPSPKVARNVPQLDEGDSDQSDAHQDPLSRFVNDDDDDDDIEANKEIVARIIATRLAVADKGEEKTYSKSKPQDPLVRIMRMEAKDEKNRMEQAKNEDNGRYKQHRQDEALTSSDKEMIARIIAIRMAQVDEEEPNTAWNSKPEDPLERIVNMNAEDQLLSAVSLMNYSASQDDSDDDDENDMIRKKDFRDLSKMIQHNDLEELERQAIAMADSVKFKLNASGLADLSRKNNTTADSDTGLGYMALALGDHKEVVNRFHAMEGLNISKITNDDEGDGRFVSMSDSILDSSMKGDEAEERTHILLGERNSSNASIENGSIASLEQADSYISQYMESPTKAAESMGLSSGFDEGARDVDDRLPRSPKKKLSYSKKATSQQWDDPVQSNSVFVSDWWGVLGDFAGIRADCWSDSQSTMSYTESVLSDSVASLGASTQTQGYEASPLPQISTFSDTLIASDVEQFVGTVDPDGRGNAGKDGTASDHESAPKSRPVHHSLSLLDQKRQRKRELEAWRSSLEKSFHKDG